MNLPLSRLLSLVVAAMFVLVSTSSAAQALFDPSKVGRKNPPPPVATASGLFADQRAPLGSKVYVQEANVLTMRQAPAFDAPTVPICANADRQTTWRHAERIGDGREPASFEFQLKAYQDARLHIDRSGQPMLEFDTLWAHLTDTAGQGCDGWLRIDAPYALEPRTGDYVRSLLKRWNDRLHDAAASVDAAITLRSSGAMTLMPFGTPMACLAGTEVVKTGETRSDGARVTFKVRVTKGTTASCRTGSVGWIRGDAI